MIKDRRSGSGNLDGASPAAGDAREITEAIGHEELIAKVKSEYGNSFDGDASKGQ